MSHNVEVYNKIKFEELPTPLVNGYSKIIRECIHSICLKDWPPRLDVIWPDVLYKDKDQRYFDVITEVLKLEDLP